MPEQDMKLIDEMIRDFTSVVPRSKSEVRERILSLLADSHKRDREEIIELIPTEKDDDWTYDQRTNGFVQGYNKCREEILSALKHTK